VRATFNPGPLAALLLGLFAHFAPAGPVSARKVGNDYYLENGLARLVLESQGPSYFEKVYARAGSGWNLVLGGKGAQGETLRFRASLQTFHLQYHSVSIVITPTGPSLQLKALAGGQAVTTIVRLDPDQPLFHYRVYLDIRSKTYFESLECEYRFQPGTKGKDLYPLDLGWCPGQRLTQGYVLADQLFHSPLALMQKNTILAALVPDVNAIDPNRIWQTAMQFQAGSATTSVGPYFSYGIMDSILKGHVYFYHDSWMTYRTDWRSTGFGYYLRVEEGVTADRGFDIATRMLWSLLGEAHVQNSIRPQYAPFDRCVRAAYDWAFTSPYRKVAWHEFTFVGRKCGGTDMYITFDRKRKGEVTSTPDNDGIWFQSWFNNMRTAYGMFLMGVNYADTDLVRRANLIKNLALTAPVDRGLFPAVFAPSTNGPPAGRWRSDTLFIPDTNRPDDFYYHVPDAAWTGYWMIRWFQRLEGDVRLAVFARDLADRLVALQLPSGALPEYVARNTFKAQPELEEAAATAVSALFLIRTHVVLHDPAHLAAARKALEFLRTRVVPVSKWWDYEALVSCTGPHITGRDPNTGLYDASTMGMIWAAAAHVEMYEATREAQYLTTGCRIMDEVSLYQHLYDKPWQLAIPSFGGFTSQNRDAEQNDARQALAAPVFLDYYRVTGREDYFHRGVAALRAGFTNMYLPENGPVWTLMNLLYPWFGPNDFGFTEENTFHNGHLGAPFIMRACNFNWGPGSAAAAVADVRLRYGDIYVDWARDRSFGLDGCLATLTRQAPDVVTITVSEALGVSRNARLVIAGVPAGRSLFISSMSTIPMSFLIQETNIPLQNGQGAVTVPLRARLSESYYLMIR